MYKNVATEMSSDQRWSRSWRAGVDSGWSLHFWLEQ